MPVAVRGLAPLSAAFAKADRDVRLGWRRGLREIAEPIRREAETLAAANITRIGRNWWKMRTGVSRKLVYVAPRQRGVKTPGNPRQRGRQFADLLMDRAMEPALHHHEPEIEAALERLLDRMVSDFNHGGPV